MASAGGTSTVVDAPSAMRPGIGVFLSAVSNEFRSCRSLIGTDLRAKQLEVRIQDEFRQADDATTLERLHTYIEGCSTVVCIVGRRSGSVPPLRAALPFLTRYGEVLPQQLEQPSYTQWELVFANALGKRLLVFHAGPDHVPDDPSPDVDHPELQASFVSWIFDDLGLNRGNFTTNDEVGRLVLREDWPVPAAQGENVRATPSRSGLKAAEAPASRIQLRARHQRGAPSLSSDGYDLRGRDAESGRLELYVTKARERVIEVVGPDGVGKKKLTSQLERDVDTTWTDPADADRVEDLLQSAWEHLHAADPSTVVPTRRDRELKSLQTLVLAADVDHVDQVRRLADAMPKSQFCLTTTRPITSDGRTLELTNLANGDEEAMLQIFTDRYLGPVPDELGPGIVEICRSHHGNPASIVQLAHNAERAGSLEQWVAENRPLSTSELPADMAPTTPGPDPAAVVACVGEAVPRDVMTATTSVAATEAAEDACRILRSSPRYRTAPMTPEPNPDPELMADVLRHTVTWSTVAGATEIFQNRAFVVRMMGWGVEHGHWNEVLEIGRHVETPMALGGRHGAWKRVLDDSLVAASALGDRAAEGWALHELGSRSLLREDNAEARVQLAQAHAVRQDVDPEGAELSRQNMRLVPGAVVSLAAILFGIALAILFLIALVATDPSVDRPVGIVEIDEEVWSPGDDESSPTVENVGPVTVELEVGDYGGSFTVGLADCEPSADTYELEPGASCRLDIEYDGTGLAAPRLLELRFASPDRVDGDKGILVIPPPDDE